MKSNPLKLPKPAIRPPRVYADETDSPRHATWLELFFDLVFVVALAELGLYLHHHLSPMGLLEFAGLFAIVWWVWLAISYYSDTYDTEEGLSQIVMIIAMFAVIFLSATIDNALTGGSFAFAAAVFALRVITTGLHLRARSIESEAKPFVLSWVGLEVLVTLIWGLSLLVPEPGRFGLWIASFVLSTAGIAAVYLGFESIEIQVSHFPERLGLFTILVLGEMILAVAVGTSVPEWGLRIVLLCGSGFVIAVAAWWLYFERFDEEAINRVFQEHDHWREARQRGLLYIFSHHPIHAGIIAIGVGVEAAIEAAITNHTFGFSGRVALCLGVAGFLLGTAITHRMSPPPIGLDNWTLGVRLAAVVFLVVLAFAGSGLSPLVFVGTISLAMLGLIAFEKTDWFLGLGSLRIGRRPRHQ